jgi:rsbT co-antagonist protein RsbR
MKNRLQRWLDALPLTSPIERQQARIFQWFLIIWIVMMTLGVTLSTAAFFSAPFPSDGPLPLIVQISFALIWISSLMLVIAPIAGLALLRRGRFGLSVSVAALGLLLSHAVGTYVNGITSGSVLIVYQVPIALAGLLGSRRLLLTVSTISIAVVVVVAYLESFSPPLAGLFTALLTAGAHGELRSLLTVNEVFDIGFFIGVTILITILLDRFGGALRAALSSSLAREQELNTIRTSLETSVAERTTALQTALHDAQTRADEQARLLSQLEEQRAMIRDLSVPVIPISETTLVMPLVGALDSARLHQLQEQSLRALERSSARTLLLDITGVPVVDSEVAQGLLMTVRAARLLGAQVRLVGIRPEVAQTIVGLGIDLKDVNTSSTLQSALMNNAV